MATQFKILTRFTNKEDGLESYVSAIDNRFAVSLKDIDAGKFVDGAISFDTERAAELYAEMIVDSNSVISGWIQI